MESVQRIAIGLGWVVVLACVTGCPPMTTGGGGGNGNVSTNDNQVANANDNAPDNLNENAPPVDECDEDGDCDDGDACNGVETCDITTGECVDGTPLDCDDGHFCNGEETCDPTNGCQAGTPPDCDDGVACTDDACNEAADSCDHTSDDAACDDAQFCNGAETCDPLTGCEDGDDPCDPVTEHCDEVLPACVPPRECVADADCDDDTICNGLETCDVVAGTCVDGTPLACDDGVFCNGAETCDPTNGCQAGMPPDCDDGVVCTVDACNTGTDSCDHTADDVACDDAQFCNGAETCDPLTGCENGDDPCDPVTEHCDEGLSACVPPLECVEDADCDDDTICNGLETCDVVAGMCVDGTPLACNDGVFCNGAETCDPTNGCQVGTPPDCDDGVVCTVDACNAGTDSCDHTPDDAACDDAQFCNGDETCNLVSGECESGTDPCTALQTCDEDTDTCIDEETLPVGCPGFDDVILTLSPFGGSTPPGTLPTAPICVPTEQPFGVVLTVGDFGNNDAPVTVAVELDDNLINGHTDFPLGSAPFNVPGSIVVGSSGAAASEAGNTYYFVATLTAAGCESVAQVYNMTVTISFEPCPP